MNANGVSALELRDYLRMLKRRLPLVALIALAATALALVISQIQTPVYRATAELLLRPRGPEVIFDQETGQRLDPIRTLQTEIRVILSQPVRERVLEQVPQAPKVSAAPIGQTDVVALAVEDPDPTLAAEAVNAYARAYIDHRREKDVQGLTDAVTTIDQQIADLRNQLAAVPGDEREALEQALSTQQETRQNLLLSARSRTGGSEVVNNAVVPTTPISPRPVRNAVLALFVGTLFGVALALALENLDDSIKSKNDLERATGGLPTLGMIPAISTWKTREEPRVVSITEPSSYVAEAYRTLRTAVQFLGVESPVRVIQVSSPSAQEGKTTTIANLAVALAKAGHQVVLICCDLRRPRAHEFFGLNNVPGFTSVLIGQHTLAQAIQPVPGVERLSLLASGPLPPNPSELLASRWTGDLLASLKAEGRLVLIDSPPVLPVTDALVLSRWVDATLIVCAAGETSRKEAARAVELFRYVDSPLVGTVLNGVKGEEGYGYGEYYRYGAYSSDEARAATNGNGSAARHGGAAPAKRRSMKKARRG